MNVLFLNPPFHNKFSRESRSPAVTKSGTLYYPKWLSYAAGLAIKKGHNVDLIDAPAWEKDVNYVVDRITAKNSKAIVIDTSTPSIVNDLKVARELYEKTNLPIMLVGRHVSVFAEEILKQNDFLNFIAIKEYEHTVCEWLEALDSNSGFEQIKSLVWRNNNDIVKNEMRPPIEDLDELPFVSEVYKRFLNIEDYYYGHSLYPLIVFDTSRGCPFKCSFCAYPQTFSGHKLRFRSVANVADEFDYIKREFPQVKTVMLEDDTFIVNKKRTLELANELINRGNKIPYDSNCRADIAIDEDFLKTLHKSGARLFCVGFESGDDKVLKHMHKDLNISKAHEFMKKCRKAKIMVHGCFMVGNLNETKQTLEKTLDLAKSLNPDTAQFYPIMVYPGTAAYEEAKQKGYLATEDFSKWLTDDRLHSSVVNLPGITHKELVEFCDKARREFYLRPSYMAHKIVQSLRNPNEFQRNWKGFKKLVGYLAKGSF